MSGCDLRDAFPDTATESGRVAAKEEKKKAKRCGGPALAFLKAQEDPDPDRQHLRPLPPAEKLKGSEGFQSTSDTATQNPGNTQWIPVKTTDCDVQERNLITNLVGARVDDVIGQKSRTAPPRAVESAAEAPNPQKDSYGFAIPSYFGKSPSSTEGFADFSKHLNDNPGYQLVPADFLGSFGAVGLGKASGTPVLTTPSVSDAWKPLTPAGARSSFFEYLPAGSGEALGSGSSSGGTNFSRDEKEDLLKKLDTLFARLEELETKRNDYAHVEISMFILSGLFLMFGLESVRKMKI